MPWGLDQDKMNQMLDESAMKTMEDSQEFIKRHLFPGSPLTRQQLFELWTIQRISNLQVVIEILANRQNSLRCSKCQDTDETESPYICQSCKEKKWAH